MLDKASVQQVRQALVSRKPEVARLVPCDGIDIPAGQAFYGHKPAVVEIGKSASRGHPDAPAIILVQRLHQIIRQSTRLTEDCSLSILPPRQTVVSGYPYAPIRGRDQRGSIVAGQTLFRRNSRDGKLSKAVECSYGGDPDV